MNYSDTIKAVNDYLNNLPPYHRIPDVKKSEMFLFTNIQAVFIVEGIGYNVRFAPKFLLFIDQNNLWNVYLASVTDNIYTIVVKNQDDE